MTNPAILEALVKAISAALAEANHSAIAKVAEATEARMKAEAALSESQALLAMAFEVAAEAAYQWWDDDDGQELREEIRALTPADAQAALDARINAAREEGRIMGLREAVECCAEREQHWGKAWRASSDFRHTAGLSDGAHILKNAILAKIKEAENG